MRIEYLSDKLWLEVTSCIVLSVNSSVYGEYDFGVVPNCGEDKSKSFTWAHKPDCWLSAYALSCLKAYIHHFVLMKKEVSHETQIEYGIPVWYTRMEYTVCQKDGLPHPRLHTFIASPMRVCKMKMRPKKSWLFFTIVILIVIAVLAVAMLSFPMHPSPEYSVNT